MTDVRVVSFNVNQNSPVAHQRADLLERMASADRILCQETVDLDLAAFAADPKTIAKVGAWGAIQVRNGDNDGHANTAVLYRISAGIPSETACVPIGDAADTRARFLTGGLFPEGWDWSAHIFPKRDSADIAAELRAIGAWVKTHPRQHVGGLDKNQASVSDLEHATGLTWHGKDIDGFLTNVPLKGLAEFPKGFSDHPGVHAVVTVPSQEVPVTQPKKSGLDTIRDLLRQAFAWATAHGKKGRARKERAALNALRKTKPAPVPTPVPAPAPEPAAPVSFPAIAAARKQSHEGPQFGVGECLMRVRICYGIPAREHDAAQAWRMAKVRHPETDPTKIPRGYPVFWTGGSHGFGHIAISAGDGNCWSTDIDRLGFFDYVPIAEIRTKWGLTLVGWTEDINGVSIDPNRT